MCSFTRREGGAAVADDQLALQALTEEAVELVVVGAGVDGDGEGAALERLEAGVGGKRGGDELGPEGGEAAELAVRPGDVALERLGEERERTVGLGAAAALSQLLEAGEAGAVHRRMVAGGNPA